MHKGQAGKNIYALPLFVDKLRKVLDLPTDSVFRDFYVSLLVDKITTSVDELLESLEGCISTDKDVESLQLDSISSRKMMIYFYEDLRRDIQQIKEKERKISEERFNIIKSKLNKRVEVCRENNENDSGGGTERRSIRNFLNFHKQPSAKNSLELHFVMTQLFPALLSQQMGKGLNNRYRFEQFESRFFKGVLQSPESIVSNLLSFKDNKIDDEKLVGAVVESLMRGKGYYESLKRDTSGSEEKLKKKNEKYTTMFEEIRKLLEAAWVVNCSTPARDGTGESLESDEDIGETDYFGIASLFTRCILSGLIGMDDKMVNQKMTQIGHKVYCLAMTAEEQSEVLWRANGEKSEMTSLDSKEKLFIAEFLLLFFYDREIRDVMNAMPSRLNEDSENAENE